MWQFSTVPKMLAPMLENSCEICKQTRHWSKSISMF